MPQPKRQAPMEVVPAPEQMLIICDDDFPLAATLFAPVGSPQAVVVLAPEMGVPRRVYFAFCQYLASKGMVGLVFDYRGCGDSLAPAGKEDLVTFENWGRVDIDAMIRAATSRHAGVPIFAIGHGCGGQLLGLAPAIQRVGGVVLVSAGLPHSSRHAWPRSMRQWLLWHLLVPLFARGPGHELAYRAGLDQFNAPVGVLRQWARWACETDYLFHRKFKQYTGRYSSLPVHFLVLGFSDDLQAPPLAVDALEARYTAAQIERRQIDVQRLGLGIGSVGHTGFFRSKSRDALWFMVLDWMTRQRE